MPRLDLQPLDQIEDLGLRGHVERSRRLVSDEDVGVAGQRHGDADALAHAAGELEGVALGHALGIGDFHLPQQVDGTDARSSVV